MTTPRWKTSVTTISGLLDAATAAAPDRLWIKSPSGELTYGDALRVADAYATDMRERVAGRIVGLMLPNSIAFLVTYHAVLRAGGLPALLNPALPDASLARLVEAMSPALLLSMASHGETPVELVNDADILDRARTLSGTPVPEPSSIDPDAAATILFSGGTTGLPKRIPHTHRALIAAVERMEWGWPTEPGDIWLPVAPFTHVYGYLMGVANPTLRAGTIVIPERFQPDLVLDLLANERVTMFGGGPPAIYQALMAVDGFSDISLPDLRVCPGGGAPFPLDVHRRWQEATGLTIHEGYGMTEIAPMSVNTESDGTRPGSAGKPVPDTEIRIADLADPSKPVATGDPGEVLVRGPHMMTGYAGNPEETAETIVDGWIRTGDIGHLDEDGFLTLTDRKKDVILFKGYSVFPREVEEILMSHPSVTQACVVARADDRAGEIALAFVVLNTGATAEEIRGHCSDNLEPYKVPSEILIAETLPLTAAGKVDRMALRNRAAQ